MANAKTLLRRRSDSPINLESKLLGEISKNLAPLSPATALASSVLPVPGFKEREGERGRARASEGERGRERVREGERGRGRERGGKEREKGEKERERERGKGWREGGSERASEGVCE